MLAAPQWQFLAYSIRGRENPILYGNVQRNAELWTEAVLLQVDNRTLDAERRWLGSIGPAPTAIEMLACLIRCVSCPYLQVTTVMASRILSLVRRRNGLIYILDPALMRRFDYVAQQ